MTSFTDVAQQSPLLAQQSAKVEGLHLQITAEEEELFNLLLQSVAYHGKQSVLRVAGGWVRDRILQKDSNDIDIALDDQSGIEFANNVNAYLQSLGLETRTIAVIQANPDQSKHLETANLRVLGFEIDCVHLRAETYSDTRIPDIRVGTALEDALRRDFNINALFYNINERCVEDFTGRGVCDLQQGILCTPLPADITFHDDPLRVLRAIRFASRLNYHLDAVLIRAARQEVIRLAMQHKVSRERVCKEIDGMLVHPSARPALSALLLHHLQMLDVCLPLQLYLSSSPAAAIHQSTTANSGVGSTQTAPMAQYRVVQPCHVLCTPWFESSPSQLHQQNDPSNFSSGQTTFLHTCESCRHAVYHVDPVACWMSMSVEVALWVQALVTQKYAVLAATPSIAPDNASAWLVHFRNTIMSNIVSKMSHSSTGTNAAQQVALSLWMCQPSDLFAVCEPHNAHCAQQGNSKILFWASLLSVTSGVSLQEIAPAASTTASNSNHNNNANSKKGGSAAAAAMKEVSLCERILREQLKMDNHTAKNTQVVLDAAFALLHMLQLDLVSDLSAHSSRIAVSDYVFSDTNSGRPESEQSASKFDILSVAQWLRVVKERWEDALLIALAFILAYVHRQGLVAGSGLYQAYVHSNSSADSDIDSNLDSKVEEAVLQSAHPLFQHFNVALQDPASPSLLVMIFDRFAAFVRAIEAYRLQEIWLLKPVLDGSAIQRALQGKIPKGPMIGKLMEAQVVWLIQYRFHYATSEETSNALVEHLHVFLEQELAATSSSNSNSSAAGGKH